MYIYVKIDGISCDNCRNKIKNELLKISEVNEVNITKNIAKITYIDKIDTEEIIKTINYLGYLTKNSYISQNINDIDNNIKLKEFILILSVIIFIIYILRIILGINIFNVIPSIDNNLSYGMLFITGLLTSIHCISMCGAINIVATYNKENKFSIKKSLLYNIGRIISYTIIGGLIGLIGNIITVNDTINGIIIILTSLVMILMSLNMMNIINFKLPHIKLKYKPNNSFLIGLLNGLMPCGPLQSMQLYALSTGSFLKGALSMLAFSLGTLPLMLSVGIFLSIFSKDKKILLNKIASVLILILSLSMLNRGISTLGININSFNKNYSDYVKSTIIDDIQEVQINLTYGKYGDILVQKGKKVKLIINVDKKYLTGCNDTVVIKEFNIKQELKEGENIIEFTPNKIGTYSMNCWMNMIKNNIKVVDNEKIFEVK